MEQIDHIIKVVPRSCLPAHLIPPVWDELEKASASILYKL